MNNKINSILNKINSISASIDAVYLRDSLTDDGLEVFERIDILKRSLKLNHEKKSYHYFTRDAGNRQREFISFLKNINRTHIQKNEDGEYIYSFIYELFTEEKDISSNIASIKDDKKKFNYLKKKYDIQPSKRFEEIAKSSLQKNQIVPFLYLWHHSDFKDEKKDNNYKVEKSLKSIFSILFYDRKSQQTFYKNIDKIEKSTNDIDFEIYHDFLQYAYLDKN